jgi:hypothetical protein
MNYIIKQPRFPYCFALKEVNFSSNVISWIIAMYILSSILSGSTVPNQTTSSSPHLNVSFTSLLQRNLILSLRACHHQQQCRAGGSFTAQTPLLNSISLSETSRHSPLILYHCHHQANDSPIFLKPTDLKLLPSDFIIFF